MNTKRSSLGATILTQRLQASGQLPQVVASTRRSKASGGEAQHRPLPAYVTYALARYRLLHEIPFSYLVPDLRLLPLESIRFFTLDAEWLDALVEGALAAAGNGSRERQRAQANALAAHEAAISAMGLVRKIDSGRVVLDTAILTDTDAGVSGTVSGFLLHSALVSGWPGLNLYAWRSADLADVPRGVDAGELALKRPDLVVRLLRMDRLAPSVLLALFEGVPHMIWLEEPHQSVQFGVESDSEGWNIQLRNQEGDDTGKTIAVPMRNGAVDGIVDVSRLAAAIDTALPLARPRRSAALALQLLQAPSRQRFHN